MDSLIVECYSGHTYAEKPESLQWQGTEYEVKQIEKIRPEPGERHFQVLTGDTKIFRLCYNEVE
ncbi:hypothetical protein ACFLT4_03615 [Chloroflexota bacterium]